MPRQTEPDDRGWSTSAKLAFAVFAVIGAFFLIAEHRAHVFPYLPWLLLAACPLMHLFMHRGHGRHGAHNERNEHYSPASDSGRRSRAARNTAARVPSASGQHDDHGHDWRQS